MKRIFSSLLLCSSTVLFVTSCQKTIDNPFTQHEESASANNGNNQSGKKKVYVSTVDELYAAVNNADNAGAQIILAPGTYLLSASYPNGGRLELQTDMGLKGQPGDSDAVLIDESALPIVRFSWRRASVQVVFAWEKV